MNNINQLLHFIARQLRGYKKDRSASRRFRAYYMSVSEDTRSSAAKIIDYTLWRILMFFFVLTVVIIHVEVLWSSTIITLTIVSIFHYISICIRNRRHEELKRQKRRHIASQRVYSELMNKTIDEMKAYMTEIFDRSGFSEFTCVNSNHRYITYEAVYENKRIMLLFYIYKGDTAVELKEVKEFSSLLMHSGVNRGLIITTSDFTVDCYTFAEGCRHQHRLTLLNKDMLLKLIELREMFPSEEEIDELVENKISQREAFWRRYRAAMLTNKKTKGYLLLSVALFFSSGYTPYQLYYRVAAAAAMLLTIAGFLDKLLNSGRGTEEESWRQFNKILDSI